jgi:glycopeptide antibiotics resistance protein
MSYLLLQHYIRTILSHIPWTHWMLMALLSLALTVFLLVRRRFSVYGAITLGITVLAGLFLLDTAVVSRIGNPIFSGMGLDLAGELDRLLHGGVERRLEMFSNVAVFVPFGFFLSEFLSTTGRARGWRRIGYVSMAAFGLSLCLELLQLILSVGFFELTDLILNTIGGFVGAGLSAVGRMVFGRDSGASPE